MNIESLTAAFLVGLLGGTHCLGMCGGIVGALSTGLSGSLRESRWRYLAAQLAYNAGRIGSYTFAGLLVGAFAGQVGEAGVLQGMPVGRYLAGVIMILFGIYLAGWWHTLLFLEKAGARLPMETPKDPDKQLAVLARIFADGSTLIQRGGQVRQASRPGCRPPDRNPCDPRLELRLEGP